MTIYLLQIEKSQNKNFKKCKKKHKAQILKAQNKFPKFK